MYKNPQQGKRPMRKILVILILLLLICMTGIGAYALIHFNANLNQSASVTSTGKTIKLDENGKAVDGMAKPKTHQQIVDELKKSQVYVTDKLGSSILFQNGKTGAIGSWVVENLKTNNVIMQCEVYLNNKLIAKSVPIRPNQHIEAITLFANEKTGTYDAIAYVNYFKLDTNEYISKAGFKVKLSIQ